ncbi:MAG: glycosyltransferase [Lachnospiraceae bacterium]|nr:glycosyltransferase [Lachnospiraceae bacterium]
MNFLKKGIKQILVEKQHKKYAKQVSARKLSYPEWIKRQEEKIETENIAAEAFSYLFLSLAECENEDFLSVLEHSDADIVLLAVSEGELSEKAIPLICQEFSLNKDLIIAYGDEDVLEDGVRRSPWFKPDWSPDTFLSGFYFGSLVAVKKIKITDVIKRKKTDDGTESDGFKISSLYLLLKELLVEENYFAVRNESAVKVSHISEILFHTKREGYEQIKDWKLPETAGGGRMPDWCRNQDNNRNHLISVIIPSKDNPQVLFTCVSSFLKITKSEIPYEILIIDNGSGEENRQAVLREIETYRQQTSNVGGFHGISYHYEPMNFNFSRMCNLGAEKAKGDLLLFFNDDMEICSSDWLTLLADKALLPYAGAIGAKLLYPDSDIIQHAGVTNLRVGPVHKLQFLSNKEDHYYGRNRGVHNMLAVTGACLMVRTEVFHRVGGFAEELAVAFNDVDLCYRIYEAGYYNIQRNDVTLYHHESLSRGNDGKSEEKHRRLMTERDILCERHPNIYGRDPFYHKYLMADLLTVAEYAPAYCYQASWDMPWAKVKSWERLPENMKQDPCVMVGVETAMDIRKWKYGTVSTSREFKEDLEECGYYFQGYSFVIGADNACYKRMLLLQNKISDVIICVPVVDEWRPDIKKNADDQLNVDLTGFAVRVRTEDIPAGHYRLGILAEDKCSRQKLVNWSNWPFEK